MSYHRYKQDEPVHRASSSPVREFFSVAGLPLFILGLVIAGIYILGG